jgi:hypothetical protein
MITEIIIEQQRLDLFEDIGAELNYAIDDIKDFSARNSNYSKTINIPGNANNNKVFGHIYNFTSGNNYGVSDPSATNVGYNFDPTKQANCQIFVNKIQVFKGVLRLLEITIQNGVIEYQCAVFGELGGFASAIGNKVLDDPDMLGHFNDTYEEYWTADNVVDSWTASGVASGLGIVYPLIDYGLCKHPDTGGGKDWHLNAFRPAFFVHELISKIIDFSGYTYTSAFFDTPYFRSLIIPNNKANLEQLTSKLLLVESTICVESGSDVGMTDYITFNLNQNLVLFSTADYKTYTFNNAAETLGKIKLYGWLTLSSPGYFTINVKKSGDTILTETFTQGVANQNIPIDWVIDVSLADTDTIAIQAIFYTGVEYSTLCPIDLKLEFESDFAQVGLATEGDQINIGNCLPKGIQQKDFFASICRMFNLYVYEDPQKTTHLLIEPYIEFYRKGAGFLKINDVGELLLHGEAGDATGLLLLSDPIADSIDWSNKVDYSKEISIKPMSELNARYYDFVYTQDDDYYNESYNKKYNESYGDRKEDTGFQFAEDRSEVKIIFSPSVLTKTANDIKLRANLFKVSNETEERKDNNVRIMFFKNIELPYPSTNKYKIKDYYNGTGTAPGGNLKNDVESYGYAGHLDDPILPTSDLNYGAPKEVYFKLDNPYPSANLFNAWWDEYLAEIINKDSKLLSCYLYLTVQDIHSLDFAQLIYIDGALWRLNKVVDFNPSIPQTTKCELLRVIELFYPS